MIQHPYTPDQIELIEARNLQPGRYLIAECHQRNQAILVESPVHLYEDGTVTAYSKITQFPGGITFEMADHQVRSLWFDEKTSVFQSAQIEWHYRADELLQVLKAEYAPTAVA